MITALAITGAGCDVLTSRCYSLPRVCVDAYTLNDCTGTELVITNCPQHCLDQDLTQISGCVHERTSNRCGCEEPSVPLTDCEPDVAECSAEGDLVVCRAGSLFGTTANFWERVSCDARCRGKGASYGVCATEEGGTDCFCDAASL